MYRKGKCPGANGGNWWITASQNLQESLARIRAYDDRHLNQPPDLFEAMTIIIDLLANLIVYLENPDFTVDDLEDWEGSGPYRQLRTNGRWYGQILNEVCAMTEAVKDGNEEYLVRGSIYLLNLTRTLPP